MSKVYTEIKHFYSNKVKFYRKIYQSRYSPKTPLFACSNCTVSPPSPNTFATSSLPSPPWLKANSSWPSAEFLSGWWFTKWDCFLCSASTLWSFMEGNPTFSEISSVSLSCKARCGQGSCRCFHYAAVWPFGSSVVLCVSRPTCKMKIRGCELQTLSCKAAAFLLWCNWCPPVLWPCCFVSLPTVQGMVIWKFIRFFVIFSC